MAETKEKTIHDKLTEIQSKLVAPKGQYNAFGKYKYRSCEDILEAVKPLLGEAALMITDSIEYIGDRFYVKATVMLGDGTSQLSTTAYAREPEARKGMDVAQVTGASSSYARKYALNGLFCIDDTKDSDATNDGKNGNEKPIDKTLAIVEQAFFNFTTENKEALAEGFIYNKDKFIKAIVKHFKKLPANEKSIPEIVKTIKPAECIIEIKPDADTPSQSDS